MALWDVMQKFGSSAFSVFQAVTYLLDKQVFGELFIFGWNIYDAMFGHAFSTIQSLFGIDMATLTWGDLIFGSVIFVMLYSICKWVLDLVL